MCLMLLAILCVPLFPWNSLSIPQSLEATKTDFSRSTETVLPAPEPPHRLVPLSIIVYTEYADLAAGEEFENTMTAIDNNYGTDYYYTNLADYTDLGALLPGHNILLIPEQELAFFSDMITIGNSWAPILTDFVNNGGIVIVCDGASSVEGPTWPRGPSSRLLNETGLMTIYGIWNFLGTNFLVDTRDALSRGVAASWASTSMTVAFDTPETTVIVDNSTNPVVVHKPIGKGHVVLIGFDFYSSQPDMEIILANAIRLHRHVVFDESHTPLQTIAGEFSTFASVLVAEGFAVSSMDSFSSAYIDACDVLVIPFCGDFYTPSQKTQIEDFVLQGGGLYLLGDWGTFGEEVNDVANVFGFNLNDSRIEDTDDNEAPLNNPGHAFYTGSNIHNHSLTIDVYGVQFYYGNGIIEMPPHAIPIITSDTDPTAIWYDGGPARGVPLYAASIHGGGRVVVSADGDFLRDPSDSDNDGTSNFFDRDNEGLAINTIRWLSAAGIVERKVLFDASHSPYISFSSYQSFANYLTSNGYTVHWMTTFYATLVETTHVLVIPGGTNAYSPAENMTIRNFVDSGGGIMFLADWTFFGDNLLPIAHEFGMSHNNSYAYLSDSDDGTGGGLSGITYEGANILPHPITEGVNRIYVDRGTAMINLGGGASLVMTDNDGTSEWYNGTAYVGPAGALSVYAANTFGLGRIVYITDINFLDSITYMKEDNNLFLVNAFQWLSENRAPVITLTYPNGGETVNNTIVISWTGIDPNKDWILGYDIEYSNDSGAHWYPIVSLGTWWSPNEYIWNITDVPNGANYLVRISAYDYELTGTDTSDATFTIDNPQLPPPPPLPWWWWIVVLVVIIVIVVVIIVYLLFRRRGTKAN